MKVQELVEKYNKSQRIDIAKLLEVKQYTSIDSKRLMASLILDECITVVDGEARIDSVEKYILFTISVIGMHTNLEFGHDDDEEYSVIDDYDLLCESGLLIKIIDTFKDDYMSCQEVLNMMTADRMQDHITIEKKIGKFLDAVQNILSETIIKLTDKMNMDDILENLPISQNKLLELFKSIE